MTLSDLAIHGGNSLHPDVIGCRPVSGRRASYNWPTLSPLPRARAKAWKRFLQLCFPSQEVEELAGADWLDLPVYSHTLLYFLHSAMGYLYCLEGDALRCHLCLSRRSNRRRLGTCSLESEIVQGALPEEGNWVEVEFTKKAIVVLCQSLRDVAAMRDQADLQVEEGPSESGLRARLDALPEALKSLRLGR